MICLMTRGEIEDCFPVFCIHVNTTIQTQRKFQYDKAFEFTLKLFPENCMFLLFNRS
jgi:hypothetical protein